MKKLLLSTGAFLSAVIIFSSCGSTGVSLTKRHYRSGYNLEVSSAKTTETKHVNVAEVPAKEVETIVVERPTEVASANSSNENSIIKHKPFSFNSNYETTSEDSRTTAGENTGVAVKGIKIKNVVKKVTAIREAVNLKQIINHKAEDGDRSLGGLIWTLVGILLVVWLISLLTGGWGLGNFLHIFLVVALVLILLRLIHVI